MRGALGLLLLLIAGAAQAQSGQLRFADLSVNGVRVAESAPIWDETPRSHPGLLPERLWLEISLLRQVGLLGVPERRIAVASREFGDVCAVPPVACYFDEATQSLSLWAPPELFSARELRLERPRESSEAAPLARGALLTYELALGHVRGSGLGLNGLAELSAFGGGGLWRGQFALDLNREHRRLQPFGLHYRRDDPENLHSLVLGQTLSQPLPGRPGFAYTGLRWASNFSLDPLQSVHAAPRFTGSLDSPSSVDVYVDGFRRSSDRFDFGRFALEAPAGAAGAADITVVVRDATGVLRSTERLSYYFSPSLLRPGLVDQSLEAGYAVSDSFRYRGHARRPFVAYSERRGLSERLSSQATLQLGSPLERGGLGFTHTLGGWVVVDWMSVLERADGGPSARRHVLGLERSAGNLSVTARAERASRALDGSLDRIGLSNLRRLDLFSVTQGLANRWAGPTSLTATALRQESGLGERSSALQLALQIRPRRELGIGVYVRRDQGQRRVDSAGLSLSLMLDPGRSVGAELRRRDGGTSSTLSGQRIGGGESAGLSSDFVGLSHAPEGDSLLAHLEREQGQQRWRASLYKQPGFHLAQAAVSGAVGWLEGVWFRSQRVADSFAVVRVEPYPEVPVFFNNRLVGRTDARGLLVLPAVPGNLPHAIAIDANALPIETAVPRPERLLTLRAGQGSLIDFEVARSASVTVRLLDERGEPLPPGHRVQLQHLAEPTYLGRRGLLYIERAEPQMRARVSLPAGRSCSAEISGIMSPLPPGQEPAFVCRLDTKDSP